MARLRRVLVATGAGLALVVGAWCAKPSPREASRASAEDPAAQPRSATVDWIVAGGGPTPESNEISIEDDLDLATRVLEGSGVLLYAGGPGTRAVRADSGSASGDPLVAELATIFDPRPSRTSTYRPTRLKPAAAANGENFRRVTREALAQDGGPLTIWISGHGDQGSEPSENGILLWGNDLLTPVDLAAMLHEAGSERQTRLVATTCFSGGFAEIAFASAVPAHGAVAGDVCGLFASTDDREAGGCDPNPARGAHDGYAVHVLEALAGKRRSGDDLAKKQLDFDRDGVVSLLDAHTWARLRSGSVDVPVTTSERWLRSVSLNEAAPPLAMPHEDAVIAELGSRLGVGSEDEALQQLAALDEELLAIGEQQAAAVESEGQHYRALAADLLSRWPVLNDPWHPQWREVVDRERATIEEFLAASEHYQALKAAMEKADAAGSARAEKEVAQTPLLRLVRAYETKRLAGALKAKGGPDWPRYERFRACENGPP